MCIRDSTIATLNKIREDLGKDFVKRAEIGRALWAWGWGRVLLILGTIGSILGIAVGIKKLLGS